MPPKISDHSNTGVDKSVDCRLETLTLRIDADLYRAFQRCTWMLINESDRDQIGVMNEMVRDFLVKHGC